MKSIVCQRKEFDLDRFIKDIFKFHKKIGAKGFHPSSYVTWVKKPGDRPEFGSPKGRDTLLDELESTALTKIDPPVLIQRGPLGGKREGSFSFPSRGSFCASGGGHKRD